ncbi:hypothetical protein Taro_044935, partial [Colocasia esculenta]|nr:hypothetical protein [Colocasia esculenta]
RSRLSEKQSRRHQTPRQGRDGHPRCNKKATAGFVVTRTCCGRPLRCDHVATRAPVATLRTGPKGPRGPVDIEMQHVADRFLISTEIEKVVMGRKIGIEYCSGPFMMLLSLDILLTNVDYTH